MKKLLISTIAAIITLGCSSNECEQVSIRAFTHVGYKRLAIYKSANGDLLKYIGPDTEAGWITKVIKSQNGYFQVNIEDIKLQGWVKKGRLSLKTRLYYLPYIALYKSADKSSKKVGYLYEQQIVKVLDACGKWAYVEGEGRKDKIRGWLEPDMQCGNPYTTCP